MSWKVYRTGEMIHDKPYYNIPPSKVFDEHIVQHMEVKVWVNMGSFLRALEEAKKIVIEINYKL